MGILGGVGTRALYPPANTEQLFNGCVRRPNDSDTPPIY